MAEKSHISWTDATFNPWMGCTKVGPGCDNCYALDLVEGRFGRAKWGPGQPRIRTSVSNWRKVEIWNAHPEKLIGSAWPGRRPRVFAASLADIFDNEVDPSWRADFWALVRRTPNLQWLIVTKRIGNAAKMLPVDWGDGYPNVVLLITVVNAEEAARDTIKLLLTPAAARGLSVEPLLGPIVLTDLCNGWFFYDALTGCRWHGAPAGMTGASEAIPRLDWVICGGESGPNARPMHPDWVRSLRDQCAEAGVPLHFKQWGEWAPGEIAADHLDPEKYYTGKSHWNGKWIDQDSPPDGHVDDEPDIYRIGKKRAGRTLDGIEHNGFPCP